MTAQFDTMLTHTGASNMNFLSRVTALVLALAATVVVMPLVSHLSARFQLLLASLSKAQLDWFRTDCLAFALVCLWMMERRRNRKAVNDEIK
jgi:succinate dehydrogenase hydrophobic anchor subunit